MQLQNGIVELDVKSTHLQVAAYSSISQPCKCLKPMLRALL